MEYVWGAANLSNILVFLIFFSGKKKITAGSKPKKGVRTTPTHTMTEIAPNQVNFSYTGAGGLF